MCSHAEVTSLRRMDAPIRNAIRVLSDTSIEWADGFEEVLLNWVSSESDLASTSDSLSRRARSWPALYHTAPARGNLVRGFELEKHHRVLEIGAGCGAVTRVLGERVGIVDALEPVESRARVLRARTRDLANVQVFLGEVGDVPPEPAYDIVIIVGVLEYVCSGDKSFAPYVEWLCDVGNLLRPGGVLVLAIENQLGVKYLAGSPEDHTNRIFDGLEGYPYPSAARTFSRNELLDILSRAGFDPVQMLGTFPDYKLPRVILAESDKGILEAVLRRLPQFPSPDWITPRPELADEGLLWQTFVRAGLADEVVNSFVALARRPGPEPVELWPEQRMAAFFPTHTRASRYGYTATVDSNGNEVVVDRRPWHESAGDGWLRHHVHAEPWVEGDWLVDWIARSDEEHAAMALRQWGEMLRGQAGARVPLDLVPHNLIVSDGGDLVAIDSEWSSSRHTLEAVAARGAHYLAVEIARTPAGADRWGGQTIKQLAERFLEYAGWPRSALVASEWLALEGELQCLVGVWGDSNCSVEAMTRSLSATQEQKITDCRLATRSEQCVLITVGRLTAVEEAARTSGRLREEVSRLREEADQAGSRVRLLEHELDGLAEEINLLQSSGAFRFARRISRMSSWILPPGSGRRHVLDRCLPRYRETE